MISLASFSPGCDVDAFAHLVRMSLPMVVIPAEAPWGFPGNPTFTLADVPEAMESPEDRLRTLVRRYLAAFGPACPRDMQHWSGLTGVREVFDGLRSELRRYRDEGGAELFDLLESEIVPGEAPAPPRFLPTWDNLLIGRSDRRRFVREEDERRVFGARTRGGAYFLIDGYVAGTWRAGRTREMAFLTLMPFRPLAHLDERALGSEGEALLRFLEPDAAAREVRVERSTPGDVA